MTVDGFDLTGKRALVVGAGSTLGDAVSGALSEAGAQVRVAPDTAANDDAYDLVRAAIQELGGLDVVVNCGDLRMAGPFEDLTDAEWDRLVATNLTTPLRLFRAAGRQMLASGGGRIIQVVSILGERGVENTAAYSACQAGLIQLIRALAIEWARRNVRINGIGVGWFEGDPLTSGEGLTRYLPTGRLGRPEEVGALAVYLASDASDMMTGQTIWVDGAILSHA